MSEPTDRDRELARDLLFPGSIPDGDCDTLAHIDEVAEALTAAREEGRREERKRCAALRQALQDIMDVIATDALIPESVSYMQQARAALALPGSPK